ncbi:MAG: hypothetical protein K8M05_17625, partial [Deltaproteobacteria bacterium]|nr:hypothetical protein [Kofleriaceae bacterium]
MAESASGARTAVSGGQGQATGTAAVVAAPSVKLAASPRIDLDANRARWHVYDRGLVVPVDGEGLRKYDLAYRSPWR